MPSKSTSTSFKPAPAPNRKLTDFFRRSSHAPSSSQPGRQDTLSSPATVSAYSKPNPQNTRNPQPASQHVPYINLPPSSRPLSLSSSVAPSVISLSSGGVSIIDLCSSSAASGAPSVVVLSSSSSAHSSPPAPPLPKLPPRTFKKTPSAPRVFLEAVELPASSRRKPAPPSTARTSSNLSTSVRPINSTMSRTDSAATFLAGRSNPKPSPSPLAMARTPSRPSPSKPKAVTKSKFKRPYPESSDSEVPQRDVIVVKRPRLTPPSTSKLAKSIVRDGAPLPSSQSPENVPPLSSPSQEQDMNMDLGFGMDDNDFGGGGGGADWDMNAPVVNGWDELDPLPGLAPVSVAAPNPSSSAFSSPHNPLPYLSSSPSPAGPSISSVLRTPASPLPPLDRTAQLIADIKARSRREAEEEMAREKERQGSDNSGLGLGLDFGDDDDDEELEDINDVLNAVSKPAASKSSAQSVFGSSPLTDLSDSEAPLNANPFRTRARLISPTPGLRKSGRLSHTPVPFSSTQANASAKGKQEKTPLCPKENKEIAALVKQRQRRDKAGITEALRAANAALAAADAPVTPPASGSDDSDSDSETPDFKQLNMENDELSPEQAEALQEVFEKDRAEKKAKRAWVDPSKAAFWAWPKGKGTEKRELLWTPGEVDEYVPKGYREAVKANDAFTFQALLTLIPPLIIDIPSFEAFLLRVATRHPSAEIARCAYRQVLHYQTSLTAGSSGITSKALRDACEAVGVKEETAKILGCEAGPLAMRDRAGMILTIAPAVARAGRVASSDLPDYVVTLLFFALDPLASSDITDQVKFAIEDAIVLDAGGVSTDLAVCKRIIAAASVLQPLQQDSMLALLPRCCLRTVKIARWVGYSMLVTDAMNALDEEQYLYPPPIQALHTVFATSPNFAITQETNYDELLAYVHFLGIALTDIQSYATSEARRAVLADFQDKIEMTYGLIKDTRAAYLDRTRAKDALQRLKMRLLYQTPKPSAHTKQGKLNFGHDR